MTLQKTPALFQRISLAGQLANTIRDAVRNGQFQKQLPSERRLCEMLNASRPIVRQAIHVLQDEGIVCIRRGYPAEIVKRKSSKFESEEKRRVVLLSAESEMATAQWSLIAISEMRRRLYEEGFHFVLLVEPGIHRKHPHLLLKKLLEQYRAYHWILAGTPASVQEWFQKQVLNVIVMGNTFPPFHLPSVNDDLRGVTHHAANLFLGLKHRNIAFLMRNLGSAGQAEEERGFLDATQSVPNATAFVMKHSGVVGQIRSRLEMIFSKEPRVTALLVSHAEDTLVAMNWFFEKGIRLPRDVSLISFQWESFLERLRPLPAWYYSDPKAHARKLCRLVFNPFPAKKSPRVLFPTFHKNETVAALKI